MGQVNTRGALNGSSPAGIEFPANMIFQIEKKIREGGFRSQEIFLMEKILKY